MKFLYLDTSSSYLYAAFSTEDRLLYEIKEKLDNNLSTFSLSLIEEIFDKLNMKPNDIDKIIVVNGPGSFTGVRIGVTIAKTWAWALNIKIIPISSLYAMAVSSDASCVKVPIIDARRNCYYAGIYGKDCEKIFDDSYISSEKLKNKLESLNCDYCFIGNEDTEDNEQKYIPNILKIIQTVKDFPAVNPHKVNPNYLKLTEAEEKLKCK